MTNQYQQYQEFQKEVNFIRENATSPHMIIKMIEELLLKYGVEIKFSSYPTSFSSNVSNSHSAPIGYPHNWSSKRDDVPTSYPGFTGKWAGSIKLIDEEKSKVLGSKVLSFSDLQHIINFINTGTGCGGANFSISGILWVYDFKKIHEEFIADGSVIKHNENEFKKCVEDYQKQYQLELTEFIKNDDVISNLNKKMSALDDAKSKLLELHQKRKMFLINDFNSKYDEEIPMPSSAFLMNSEIKSLKTQTYYTNLKTVPNSEGIIKRIDNIINELKNLYDTFPELFI